MKKIKLLTILLFPVVCVAQVLYSGGSGHFAVGTTYLPFNSVNAFMKSQGFQGFHSSCLTIGGSGYGVYNNFILGGEGTAIAPQRVVNENSRAALAVGYGMISTGYILPLESKAVVYPVIGFGWGGSDIKMTTTDGKRQTYNALKLFINTEVNLDLYINAMNKGSKSGFKCGLALGYMYNPYSESWTDENGKTAGISTTYVNGFYVKLKIGGGRLTAKEN